MDSTLKVWMLTFLYEDCFHNTRATCHIFPVSVGCNIKLENDCACAFHRQPKVCPQIAQRNTGLTPGGTMAGLSAETQIAMGWSPATLFVLLL